MVDGGDVTREKSSFCSGLSRVCSSGASYEVAVGVGVGLVARESPGEGSGVVCACMQRFGQEKTTEHALCTRIKTALDLPRGVLGAHESSGSQWVIACCPDKRKPKLVLAGSTS